jgi:hypothetical protein
MHLLKAVIMKPKKDVGWKLSLLVRARYCFWKAELLKLRGAGNMM